MSGRSPARLLAPLALAVTAIAFISVLSSGGSEEESAPAGASGTRPVSTTPSTKETTRKERREDSRSYTVKPGDTPSSIADDAGIPLAELLDLNPDIDPQALSPGQKLKLGP